MMMQEHTQTLRQKHVQTLRQEEGFSSSVFKELNEWLEAKDNLEKVTTYFPYQRRSSYRSYVDMILCYFIPIFKYNCRLFYKGEGRPLRQLMSKELLVATDLVLLQAVKLNMEGGREDER